MTSTITKHGLLYKKGGIRKNWLQRRFLLRAGALSYFELEKGETTAASTDTADSDAAFPTQLWKGTIKVLDISEMKVIADDDVTVGKKSGRQNKFALVTEKRTYYLSADTAKEREEWIAALKSWMAPPEEAIDEEDMQEALKLLEKSKLEDLEENTEPPRPAPARKAAQTTLLDSLLHESSNDVIAEDGTPDIVEAAAVAAPTSEANDANDLDALLL